MRNLLTTVALIGGLAASAAGAHPLESLNAEEYQQINRILREAGTATEATLFPLIELAEAPKAEVLAWRAADPATRTAPDRKAMVQYVAAEGFREALVNITAGSVESDVAIEGSGQPMILFAEFLGALEGVLGDPQMIEGLAKRGLTPDQAFCLPLTAGNFFTGEYGDARLMKVPCYVVPSGSNFYARPIEGLFALFDVGAGKVLKVIDTGVVALAEDAWGYTEAEVAERAALRPAMNPVTLSQPGGANYTVEGSHVEWDIWRFDYRIDKRPGLVLSNLDVKDGDAWRSVIYQTHLSEVFVPYMDPTEGWYWRTYMDSGEYGFGLFLSPLRAGVDCPAHATFLPAMIADDNGNPLEIPDAICIFERSIGDPAWRHFEVFAQTPDAAVPAEGRPETELVIRTASEVGNYDYLIDYRLHQHGEMHIMIGATGLDAVKGVASTSLADPTAAEDTRYGTLIAPNLVAANHDHYFNFRVDFDIDQPVNQFSTIDIVPAEVAADAPRRSMWTRRNTVAKTELDGRFRLDPYTPRMALVSNPAREGYLGHAPGWMIDTGDVAYGPYDFQNDPPFKRNGYVEYSNWTTVHDPEQRYAGGKYALQGDGSDTLAEWVKVDRPLEGQDVVAWFTAGFHHIPRMEDWPVMSTEWKSVHIQPFNFFAFNPALTIRDPDHQH
ncbi:MAG: tyramine oxidase [Alphaproteobacteria bacterium HGW-Alphaproteobacteria-6]|nr:MAG: tyramine oxidase [Alphaproteobacteria bacterium HGW-Alphaproteobacteria-6]